jgi:hypothetical protein
MRVHAADVGTGLLVAWVLWGSTAGATEPKLHVAFDGELSTGVTGRGSSASVAWPDGMAGLTPHWMVAQVVVDSDCSDGPPQWLSVRTQSGPSAAPQSYEVVSTHLNGATSKVSLYLWSQEALKRACPKEGWVAVPSVPVELAVACPGGVQRATQVLNLAVACEPSAPSDEALNGIAGSKVERRRGSYERVTLPRATSARTGSDRWDLQVGKPVEVKLELRLRNVFPTPTRVTPVRLSDAGKVLERYPDCFVAKGPVPDDAECQANLTITPQSEEPLHFACEVQYLDGTSVLTRTSTVGPTPTAKADRIEITPAQRAEGEKALQVLAESLKGEDVAVVRPKFAEFVRSHPIFAYADFYYTHVWAGFRDGTRFAMDFTPRDDAPPSPEPWLSLVTAGHAAFGNKDYSTTLTSFRQALSAAEQLGPDDPHVAASLNLVAGAIGGPRFTEDPERVRLYERELALETKLLGEHHPKRVRTLLMEALAVPDGPEREATLWRAVMASEGMTPPDVRLQQEALGSLSDWLRRHGNVLKAMVVDRRANRLPDQLFLIPERDDPISRMEAEGISYEGLGTSRVPWADYPVVRPP